MLCAPESMCFRACLAGASSFFLPLSRTQPALSTFLTKNSAVRREPASSHQTTRSGVRPRSLGSAACSSVRTLPIIRPLRVRILWMQTSPTTLSRIPEGWHSSDPMAATAKGVATTPGRPSADTAASPLRVNSGNAPEDPICIATSPTDSEEPAKSTKRGAATKRTLGHSHTQTGRAAKTPRVIPSPRLRQPPATCCASQGSPAIWSSVPEVGLVTVDDPLPLSFLTWNLNGLLPRVRASQWRQFAAYIEEAKPPTELCVYYASADPFREGRDLSSGDPAPRCIGCRKGDGLPRHRGAVRIEADPTASAAERREIEQIAAALREALKTLPDYKVLMSLADWKYSGQFLLLRRHLKVEALRYNLNETDPNVHHAEGRVIIADFGRLAFLTTYSPNNGWAEQSFQRRKKWDEELLAFVKRQQKPLIWMGDANCAPTDLDLSHPKIFRSAHSPDPKLKPENVGQPGCTDAERARLQEILHAGKLVDVYRHQNPRSTPPPVQDSAYTWRGYKEDRSLSSARGMRLDHAVWSLLHAHAIHRFRDIILEHAPLMAFSSAVGVIRLQPLHAGTCPEMPSELSLDYASASGQNAYGSVFCIKSL
ncbi:uncharacterized protein LOC34619267 [Cyclospora cayetanensis]|uniref:Uncharacterized protein LOC34619267 n=1 Tax=Cyclospora cayetanensis TaxID=88456 RepID=A0A6P6RV51_9EIME|nr:uncharacterized protein LOC34619267 [Cyclospora cayetanensis]